MSTGYSHPRAKPHDIVVELVFALLEYGGYRPEKCDVNGDEPDIKIQNWRNNYRTELIDVKTRTPGKPNYTIKRGALATFVSIWEDNSIPVHIITCDQGESPRMFVDTPGGIIHRIISGPYEPTGNGSNTEWFKVEPGGVPFEERFPEELI